MPHPEPANQPSSSPISGLKTPICSNPVRLKKASSVGSVCGNDSSFTNKADLSTLMVSIRNTSRSNTNPPRTQDPPGEVDSRPPGALETMQANTDEVEALRLTNQRLIGELEQLTRQMQCPREARQTQEDHNIPPHEGQPHPGTPRGVETEVESSRAKGHGPHQTLGEEGNEATLGGHRGNDGLQPPQQGMGKRSWEQRFKGLQQELNRMKEVVKGRAPDSMDTLV